MLPSLYAAHPQFILFIHCFSVLLVPLSFQSTLMRSGRECREEDLSRVTIITWRPPTSSASLPVSPKANCLRVCAFSSNTWKRTGLLPLHPLEKLRVRSWDFQDVMFAENRRNRQRDRGGERHRLWVVGEPFYGFEHFSFSLSLGVTAVRWANSKHTIAVHS